MCLTPNNKQGKTENDGGGIYGREWPITQLSRIISETFYRFVTLFWPKKVKASKLEEIHAKMVMKEAAPRAGSDPKALQKPRAITTNLKTNGSSSSSRTNGKSYR